MHTAIPPPQPTMVPRCACPKSQFPPTQDKKKVYGNKIRYIPQRKAQTPGFSLFHNHQTVVNYPQLHPLILHSCPGTNSHENHHWTLRMPTANYTDIIINKCPVTPYHFFLLSRMAIILSRIFRKWNSPWVTKHENMSQLTFDKADYTWRETGSCTFL